ncbi:RBBP9/YdeN family alpha/beta hydrolase [Agromyces sp. SYSU T0242]|uniref:RBBP9/YdeN family alpha/beta hydrolase n=1 Tax=Agromyces litoreus TaxID=3158561 RepID=UPI003390FE9B
MPHPLVLVPGVFGSGATHWQSAWERTLPEARRIAPASWDRPDLDDWIRAVDAAVAAASRPPIVVAHSLGCLAVAHWAMRAPAVRRRAVGAFLVAPPDPDAAAFPPPAVGFTIADGPLPLPSVVLGSSDDPYATPERIAAFAVAWGARLVELGPLGHVNADSGLGEWPEGLRLLEEFAVIPG